MKQIFNFRQGIIKFPKRPNFFTGGRNCINLTLSESSPAILNFAHGRTDYYLTLEQNIQCAWRIPENINVWPYWEIDKITAEVHYKFTTIDPFSTTYGYGEIFPNDPEIGQFFFDRNDNILKQWNGQGWIEKIAIFLGKFNNSTAKDLFVRTSQVGLNYKSKSGNIIFDKNQKPVKRFYGTFWEFVTTADIPESQLKSIDNVKYDKITWTPTAAEDLPAYSLVNWDNSAKLANNNLEPAKAIVLNEYVEGETCTLINKGFIVNRNWQWEEPENTILYCGENGELTTQIDFDKKFIQNVGYIIDPVTIYFDPEREYYLSLPTTPTPTPTPTPSFIPI